MMEQQQHPLDICVLEAAASFVAEQMLPDDAHPLPPPQPESPVAAQARLIEEQVDCSLLLLNDNAKDSRDTFLSAAEARKRRKKIITSHRKSNDQPQLVLPPLDQATKGDASAMIDNLSLESFKRKHEDISNAVESALQTCEVLEVDIAPLDRSTSSQNAGMTNHTSSTPEINCTPMDKPPSAPPWDATTTLSDSDNQNHKNNHKKKTQVRYEPAVPMDKDQLTAWRREARRVRNRESAAASRMKTKERIQELEEQVGCWKQKYLDAIHRLQELQQQADAPQNDDEDATDESSSPGI